MYYSKLPSILLNVKPKFGSQDVPWHLYAAERKVVCFAYVNMLVVHLMVSTPMSDGFILDAKGRLPLQQLTVSVACPATG